jgi:hypothetical protein
VKTKTPNYLKRFTQLFIFALAMGLLEAIVVVYARELYYPEGFQFPLTLLPEKIIYIEYLREITTMVMLVCIGIVAGHTKLQRFSFFLFAFGVWDIFYYTGLKLLLNWPASLLTWDILFLIPIPWIGPVLAPLLCSLGFIGISLFLEHYQAKGKLRALSNLELAILWTGALVIIISFAWDFASIILNGGFLPRFFSLVSDREFQIILTTYIPSLFHWDIFIVGVLLVLLGLFMVYKRMYNPRCFKRNKNQHQSKEKKQFHK